MITLYYKPKSIKFNLIFGIIWLILGVAKFTLDPTNTYFEIGFIIVSLGYFLIYYHMKFQHYATITDEFIKRNGLSGKKILVKDITSIKEFAGDVTFKTAEKEVTINTNFITEQSAIQLKEYVQKLKTAENFI